MKISIDCVFINPNAQNVLYQGLSDTYSAVEPPTWSLLLAQACRSNGFKVAIVDTIAEKLSDCAAFERIKELDPKLICFVVYGQNPNSGTTQMEGAIRLAKYIKQVSDYKICFVGSHTSALPREVLAYECVDFVLQNEGVYAIQNLLRTNLKDNLHQVKGIGYKQDKTGVLTNPEIIVPTIRMDIDLPGYAWDLLPYNKKPLDLYRAHYWHSGYTENNRSPFAALYTSLGCKFKCKFCMINTVNKTSNEENTHAGMFNTMRFWSPEFIIREFDKLVQLGLSTIRISDEMFLLNKTYYTPLLKLIKDRYGDSLNMWTYARVDTIRSEESLELLRSAGVRWLGIGIESEDTEVRADISKGSFLPVNIRDVVKKVKAHDIKVGANYLFGLPEDTMETMQRTLDLSLELQTEFWNGYACQALPGSELHLEAKQNGTPLPENFSGYSFYSYDCLPLPTKTLSAAEVLAFRDAAFQKYYSDPGVISTLDKAFGKTASLNIQEMTKIKLKRKILGD